MHIHTLAASKSLCNLWPGFSLYCSVGLVCLTLAPFCMLVGKVVSCCCPSLRLFCIHIDEQGGVPFLPQAFDVCMLKGSEVSEQSHVQNINYYRWNNNFL